MAPGLVDAFFMKEIDQLRVVFVSTLDTYKRHFEPAGQRNEWSFSYTFYTDLAEALEKSAERQPDVLVVESGFVPKGSQERERLGEFSAATVLLIDASTVGAEEDVFLLEAHEYVMLDKGGAARKLLPGYIMKAYRACQSELANSIAATNFKSVMQQLYEGYDPIVSFAPDGTIDYYNKELLKLLGIRAREISSVNFFDLVHPESREWLQRTVHGFETGKITSVRNRTIRLVGKTHREVIVECNLGSRIDADKNLVAIRGVLRDVTEVVNLQNELKSSEEKYRMLVESANDIIYSSDADGYLVYINQHGSEFLGISKEDFSHVHLTSFIDQRYREKVTEFYEQQFRESKVNSYLEFPIVSNKGIRMWVGQRIRLLFDEKEPGRLTGFLGVVRDITEKRIMEQQLLLTNKVLEKRVAWRTNELEKINSKLRNEIALRAKTEEALKQSEREYRELFQHANDAVIIFDLNSELIVEVNEQSLALYGYSVREFLNLRLRDISEGFDFDEFINVLNKNSRNRCEATQLTRDGKRIIVDIHATLVKYKGVDSVLCINRDLTLKKETEEELSLERRRRFTALIDGQEMERKRLSRELHDGLGQLLTASLIYLKQLNNAVTGEKALDLVKKTREIIEDTVVEVRSISHNLMPAVLSDFGLETALKNMVSSIKEDAKRRVRFVKKGELVRLNSDIEIGLYRIAQEALNNSVKYSGAKNISVNLSVSTKNELRLTVTDDGVGFETVNGGTGGPGNGIYNMKQRASIINCEIEISSSKDKGTRVVVLHKLG